MWGAMRGDAAEFQQTYRKLSATFLRMRLPDRVLNLYIGSPLATALYAPPLTKLTPYSTVTSTNYLYVKMQVSF